MHEDEEESSKVDDGGRLVIDFSEIFSDRIESGKEDRGHELNRAEQDSHNIPVGV